MNTSTRCASTFRRMAVCVPAAVLCMQYAVNAALAADAKKPYYTEPPLYEFRPNPDREETVFGDVGVSGVLINFYKGVVATVDKIRPGTPADGKFKPGQIIAGVNGVALEGRNPYVVLGSALTKAESTDGVLVFDVKDNATAPAKKVKVVIPVLGSYGDTWPLNSKKSEQIIRDAAKFYSTDKAFKKEFLESEPSNDDGPIGAALACLFLLSTGDDQYLPCVKEYFHRFIPAVTNIGIHTANAVTNIGGHTWNNGYNGIACAEYYLRTGDAEVLPVIQYFCDDAAARQYYGCAWGHWGATPTPSYTSGGTMNAAGTQMLTVMLLGKECGVKVDDAALLGALRYVYRFAGHGGVPYGNHRTENWLGANGKNGMIAAAMQIAAATQGDPTIYQLARNCLGMVMLTSYPNLICGHGDEGRSDGIWRGIASTYVRDVKPELYYSIMGSLAWYYDLCRRPSGAFGMSGNLEFNDIGSGAGIALAYTAPLKTLRITGAAPSKYSKKFTLPAWLWGRTTDLAFLSIEKNPTFASYGKPDLIETPLYALATVSATNRNAMPKNEILKNVYHESYVIRANAALALKRIGAFGDLENLLDNPDPRVRRAAIDGMANCFWAWIGFCGANSIQQKDFSPRMIASLKRMLSDTNEAVYVVDGALTAMSLAPPAAINDCVPLIMPWLKHDDWWLREAAFMALFALRTDPTNFEKVLPALVDTMTKEYQPMPRDLFVDSLQPLIADKASPVGKELLAGMIKAVETTEVKPDRGPYRRSREGGYNVRITAQACLRKAPETALQVAHSLRPRIPSLDVGDIMGLADSLLATTNSLKPADRDDLFSILYTDFRKELMQRLATDPSVLDKVIGLLVLKHPDVAWHVLGAPLPVDRTWRFMSFNPQEKDVLPPREKKRFRDVALPAGTENWFAPEFNDTAWKSGKAPIGVGATKGCLSGYDSGNGITVSNQSAWGDGEFLLTRTTFDLDATSYDFVRIRVLAKQGFYIYLNGHKVGSYVWWQDSPQYTSIMLGPDETKWLKKGRNVLAVYTNVDYPDCYPPHRRGLIEGKALGQADVYLEGLNMQDITKYDKL